MAIFVYELKVSLGDENGGLEKRFVGGEVVEVTLIREILYQTKSRLVNRGRENGANCPSRAPSGPLPDLDRQR